MSVAGRENLPFWPALLNIAQAAAYCGMCEVTFRALVAQRKVAAVDHGFRLTHWRRRDLDAMIDALPPRPLKDDVGSPDVTPQLALVDPAAAALDKIRRLRRA